MENQKLKNRIVKNSVWNFLVLSLNRFGALIFTVVLARFLMPESFGIYSLALSVSMLFYTFADLGINQAIVTYLSSSLAKKKKQAPAYYRYLLKIKFLLSLISSVVLFIAAYPLSYFLFSKPELFLPLIVASFYVFVTSFEVFHEQIFYSIEKVNFLGLKEFIKQILRIVLSIASFLLVASSYHVIGVFFALILTSVILILFTLYYLNKFIPDLFSRPSEKVEKKRVLKFIGFLTIALIANVVFNNVDSIVLGIFLSAEFVGYYRAAFSLVFSAVSFVAFPNAILLPIFSKLGRMRRGKVMCRAFRYMSIISIPMTFGIIILGRYFIKFLYGSSYMPSSLPLYFLALFILPTVGSGLFMSLLIAEEKSKILAKMMPARCIFNIVLNILLVNLLLFVSPLWATAGAAISTSASWFFYFFSLVYFSKKELDIRRLFKPLVKPLIASLVMSVILIFYNIIIEDMTLFLGIIGVLLGILVYSITMLLIKGIAKEDIDLLRILIKK